MSSPEPKKMTDLPDEVSQDLSPEDMESLDRLRRFRDMHNQVPPEKQIPITNPDKYSFPLGMDDEGNLNVDKQRSEPK
jgi:hypothetical protein